GGGHVEVARPASPDEGGEQHVVPQAGHREQLGNALDQADDGGLKVGQLGHLGPFTWGIPKRQGWPCPPWGGRARPLVGERPTIIMFYKDCRTYLLHSV